MSFELHGHSGPRSPRPDMIIVDDVDESFADEQIRVARQYKRQMDRVLGESGMRPRAPFLDVVLRSDVTYRIVIDGQPVGAWFRWDADAERLVEASS